MENISAFYPVIFECVVNVVKLIIAIVFSVVILPWVKKCAIPWLKEKRLYGIIKKFVRAAEKLGEAGLIDKKSKLDYVSGLLKKRGINVDAEVRALIESAVGDLDDEISHGMLSLIDALNSASEMEEIVIESGKVSVNEKDPAPETPNAEEEAEEEESAEVEGE